MGHKILFVAGVVGICWTMFFSGISYAQPEITIRSNPPLPLENLVKNSGFENGLEGWTFSGNTENAKEEGWEVKLSDDTHEGKNSLYIRVEPKARQQERGVYQSLTSLFSSQAISPGKSYFTTCWVKASGEVTNAGGTVWGAGTNFAVWDSDWKKVGRVDAKTGGTKTKWKKIVSNPFTVPQWGANSQFTIGVGYTSGEAWIDDVGFYEAYVDLGVDIQGTDLLQVIIEDETGKMVFDSGSLPEGATGFSKTIKVPSVYTYRVKVLDKTGGIYEKVYPSPIKNSR